MLLHQYELSSNKSFFFSPKLINFARRGLGKRTRNPSNDNWPFRSLINCFHQLIKLVGHLKSGSYSTVLESNKRYVNLSRQMYIWRGLNEKNVFLWNKIIILSYNNPACIALYFRTMCMEVSNWIPFSSWRYGWIVCQVQIDAILCGHIKEFLIDCLVLVINIGWTIGKRAEQDFSLKYILDNNWKQNTNLSGKI